MTLQSLLQCRCRRTSIGRSLWLAALTLLFALLSAATRAEAPLGPWHGDIQSPSGPLTVVVTLTRNNEGALAATFEVPAQAPGVQIETEGLRFENGTLEFRVPRAAASYSGQLSPDGGRITGVFNQGIEMPLELRPGRPTAAVVDGLDGRWNGSITRGTVTLRLVLNISTTEAGTFASLDSPDQGASGIPVSDLARDGARVRFRVPAVSVAYDGELDAAGRLCGRWQRPGMDDAEVCFDRADAAETETEAAARPQEPGDDLPYRTVEVRFANPEADGVELAGTLTLPEGKGPFPAAVLISGSGPQDRDEAVMGHRPFLVLADHLTRRGIAVLRYDDRGYGASSGDFWAATTQDFASDAAAAARWLAGHEAVDPSRVGLIGHSEGGLAAPLAARDNEAVSYVVLLAAPGVNMVELIAAQTRLIGTSQGMTEADFDRIMPINRRIWGIVSDASTEPEARTRLDELLDDELLAELGVAPDRKSLLIENTVRPWLRELLRFDPAPDLAALQVPVLAINGSLDLQVPADQNLPAIEAALAGNADATTVELPGLNHLFQTATTGSIGEYREIEETFAPVALQTVSDWILARFGSR